jgi:putative transposase
MGTSHHSDQGVEYGIREYWRRLKSNGIQWSMSRPGNCWGNAVAESFFGTFKNEPIHREPWLDGESVLEDTSETIEVFCHQIPGPATIGNISSAKFED